ncbi:MAG: outer membrane beta-barrel protein, partial [Candidatus Methylomirabilales bacterium]
MGRLGKTAEKMAKIGYSPTRLCHRGGFTPLIMNRIVLILVTVLIFLLPLSALGQDKPNFFAVKAGLYVFTGDLEDAGHDEDDGFNGEIAYGYYLHPNFALEGGTGYFHERTSEGNDIRGVPLLLTAKGIYPIKNVELFAGGGINVSFAKFRSEVDGVFADDTDTVFGGHFLIGANLDVLSTVFIGFEGKYLFTDEAEFNDVEADLNGFTIMAALGF